MDESDDVMFNGRERAAVCAGCAVRSRGEMGRTIPEEHAATGRDQSP